MLISFFLQFTNCKSKNTTKWILFKPTLICIFLLRHSWSKYAGSVLSARDVAAYAFVASRSQSWELQDHILRNNGVANTDPDYASALERLHESLPDFDLGGFSNKDTAPKKPHKTLANALCCRIAQSLGEDFHLSPRQKAVIECLQRPHAQDFLTVIPIEGLGQRMSAVEYQSILKYRLMIPMFPNDETCPVCRKACLDKYGEHALNCRELPGFKYRHDFVRDALMDILRRAGISAKKEALVNFLTDPSEGRSTLRPTDVLVFGWEGGKHACVDLTGVSPLAGFRENGFVAGQAVLKAESKKVESTRKLVRIISMPLSPWRLTRSAPWRRRQFGSCLEFSVWSIATFRPLRGGALFLVD
ncbi:putative exostosin [Helianthus anomalus]